MEQYGTLSGPLRRDWILYADSVAAPKKDLIAALWYRNMLHALEAIVEVRFIKANESNGDGNRFGGP